MKFREDALADFHRLFDRYETEIRHFPGCMLLELHQDADDPLVRYTHSHWQDGDALAAYRASSLFAMVWPQTKALFDARPQAFSLKLLKGVK